MFALKMFYAIRVMELSESVEVVMYESNGHTKYGLPKYGLFA